MGKRRQRKNNEYGNAEQETTDEASSGGCVITGTEIMHLSSASPSARLTHNTQPPKKRSRPTQDDLSKASTPSENKRAVGRTEGQKRMLGKTDQDDLQYLGSTAAQATALWKLYCKHTQLSLLEQECPLITAEHIRRVDRRKPLVDPTKQKTAEQVDLTKYLRAVMPELGSIHSQTDKRRAGSPFVVILSASATRANELAKHLRICLKSYKTIKLFAKHLKLEDQEAELRAYQTIGCGTPHRVRQLLERGSLSLTATKLIILDMARNAKQFHLLSLPGVAEETCLLLREYVLLTLQKETSPTKLALY